MRKPTMSASRQMIAALAGVWMSAALAGCASNSTPQARTDGSCVISGCASEVCADEPMFSTCIFREENVCYQDAFCARQSSGACGWTPTPELTACLAAHGAQH
jgi:hypothetical protein